MGAYPLAALHVQPPQTDNPVSQMSGLVQLKSLLDANKLRQQLMPGQIQAQQLENEQRQQENAVRAQQLKDQQAMTAAMQNWDGKDYNELPGLVMKHGGSATAVMGLKAGITKQQQDLANLTKDQLANQATMSDQLLGHIDAIKSVTDPTQRAQVAQQQASQILSAGLHKGLDPQSQQMIQAVANGQMVPTDDQLSVFEKGLTAHQKQLDNAQKVAQVANQTAETNSKYLAQVGQTMGNAINQKDWESRREFLSQSGVPGAVLKLLPDQFSPDAAQQAKAMAVTPEKQASLPDVQQYIQNYLKANNLPDTPANRLKAHSDYIQKTKVVPQVSVITATNPLAGAPAGGSIPGTGEDSLQGMKPNQATLVRMVANYEADPAQYRSNRNPSAEADLIAAAKRYNPQYDQTAYAEKNRLRSDFGKQQQAFNTATHHLDMLNQAVDALNNTSSPIWNKIKNEYKVQVGNDATTNFNTIKEAVAAELSKTFKGGQATDSEIQAQQKNLNTANSPEQLKGAIAQYVGLMKGRLEGLEETYEGQIGIKPNFQLISPRSQKVFDSVLGGGGTPQGGGSKTASPATVTPQTHTFSVSAWKKANPNGDAEAAKALAQKQGYQVVQ